MLVDGGSADGMVLPEFITHLVSLSRRKPYTVAHDLASHLARSMTDTPAQDMRAVDPLARWVNDCRESGPVFVQCAAGLIRARRSPACLCNGAFEGWLRGLPPEGQCDAALRPRRASVRPIV